MQFDLSSADALLSGYRAWAPSGLPGGSPAWVAIAEACGSDPESVPIVLEAARRVLASGSDLERAEWLSIVTGRSDDFWIALLDAPPDWAEHVDPERPPGRLGARIVEAVLAGVAQRHRDVVPRAAELVARFGAWDAWLRFWVEVEPAGKGLQVLRDHVAAGRPLTGVAGFLGVSFGGFAPAALLQAASLVAASDPWSRDRFRRAAEESLDAAFAGLVPDLRRRLGFEG